MDTMITIPCVILSGGKSSRMECDKSLLPFGDFKTIIEYQYVRLGKIFSSITISSKTNKFDFPCTVICDTSKIFSPMVALDSIFETISDERICIISVDTPFVKEETLKMLCAYALTSNYEVVVPRDQHKTHNLIGVFSKKIHPKIKVMLEENNHKINMLLTQKTDLHTLFFEDTDQFANINTKEDYQTYCQKKIQSNR